MNSTTISRLYTSQIANGQLIDATYLSGEFDQLVTANNNQNTDIDNLLNNNITIAGNKTFSGVVTLSNTTPLFTDKVAERTTNNGIAMQNQFGAPLAADPGTPVEGMMWYHNGTGIKIPRIRLASLTKAIPHASVLMPGKAPVWKDAATITIKSGTSFPDSTGIDFITFSSDQDVAITTSGANGLDTGAEASSTWYYVYIIKNPSTGTVGGLLSVTNESVSGTVTLPSGYTLKKQLPLAMRNDGSSNFLRVYHAGGWPYSPRWMYNVSFTEEVGPTAGTTNVKANGVDTSFTSISCSSFIPPLSRVGVFNASTRGASEFWFTEDDAISNGINIGGGGGIVTGQRFDMETTTGQAIKYKRLNGAVGADLDVAGYVVTEMAV